MGLHLMQPAIFAALLLRPLLHVHEQQQHQLSAVRCDAPVALAARAFGGALSRVLGHRRCVCRLFLGQKSAAPALNHLEENGYLGRCGSTK